MPSQELIESQIQDDPRFQNALHLFNSREWYPAHDAFEELWHETEDPYRKTLQGLLQIAVAEVHLERGNKTGALILYGEGIGRLKRLGIPNLGLDLKTLCKSAEIRLKILQRNENPPINNIPVLFRIEK